MNIQNMNNDVRAFMPKSCSEVLLETLESWTTYLSSFLLTFKLYA